MRPLRPGTAAPLGALILAAALALTGCSSDAGEDTPTPSASVAPSQSPESASTSPSEAPEGTRIELTFKDGNYNLNGTRIEVEAGEPFTLVVDSDAEGSLHVHSHPEQEVEFTAGVSEHEITIEEPGVVEVESHHPEMVVFQLLVS